jgi:colicin import membrane protein
LKAKAEREADLKRQLAEDEHRAAVEASPAREPYLARLASRIQNAWTKPPSAGTGLDCLVTITQIPGGEVTSAHVTQCNGDAAARQSIENAVLKASPLPSPSDPALFERTLVIHFHPEE